MPHLSYSEPGGHHQPKNQSLFEAANGVTAATNGVTAATNGITAAASGVTAAAVMSIQYWKKLDLPIPNATSWLHLRLEDPTFLLRLLKKALMALPVLYLSTWTSHDIYEIEL